MQHPRAAVLADKYIKNPKFSNIIYRHHDMTSNASAIFGRKYEGDTYNSMLKEQKRYMEEQEQGQEQEPDIEDSEFMANVAQQRTRRQTKTFNIKEHNTCFMALIADHTFFKEDGGGDSVRTYSLMTQTLAGATLIYRHTNFEASNSVGCY